MTSTGTPAPSFHARACAAGRLGLALVKFDLANMRKVIRVTRKIICWTLFLIMSVYTMITFISMMRAKRGMIMKSKITWQQAKIMRDKIHSAAKR